MRPELKRMLYCAFTMFIKRAAKIAAHRQIVQTIFFGLQEPAFEEAGLFIENSSIPC